MRNLKKGFTIVELVIVIAVVAILAAVLIPTFSNIIAAAKLSNDRNFVTQANKALLYDSLVSKKSVTYEDAKAMLKNAGYTFPCKPETKDLRFYWAETENRVILVYEQAKIALYPEDFVNMEVKPDWIDLWEENTKKPSVESETQTDDPDTQIDDPEEKQDTPKDEKEHEKPERSNIVEEILNGFINFLKYLIR